MKIQITMTTTQPNACLADMLGGASCGVALRV